MWLSSNWQKKSETLLLRTKLPRSLLEPLHSSLPLPLPLDDQ